MIADVHGNAHALEAVSRELRLVGPDAVVFLGDTTYGPLPEETWSVVGVIGTELADWAYFVRGNGERALTDARELKPV